jgi:tetratricopeptide (TPR) repeat protein
MQRNLTTRRVILLLAAVSVLPACGRNKTSEATSNGRTVVANIGAPVSDLEHQAFAKDLMATMKSSDRTSLANIFDYEALIQAALSGLGISESGKADFQRGFMSSVNERGGPLGDGAAAVANGGTFRLLRLVDTPEPKRLRFRMTMPNGEGVNYIDLVLSRRANNVVKAVDFYSFASGEYFTQSVRRTGVTLAAEKDKGILARLTGADRDFAKYGPVMKRMGEALRESRFQEALNDYETLPDSLKKEKMFMLVRVRAAMGVSDQKYQEAMEVYRSLFPNDPSTVLVSIDHFAMKKEFAKCTELIDQLDTAVGGDPYLDILRASMLIEQKRFDEAISTAQKAAKDLPDFPDTHFALISACLAGKRYGPIPHELDALEKDLHIPLANISSVPEYAGFAKSPEYLSWKRARGK